MKVYGNIIALLTLNASVLVANAFTVHSPKRIETSLSSSIGTGTRTETNIGVAARPGTGTSSGLNTYSSNLFKTSPGGKRSTKDAFDKVKPVRVQGDTLRTCALSEGVERVEIFLKTEGRPLNSNVELWQGPDNCPQKMSVYLEDGSLRPFRATVECPGSSNSIAIRNTGQMEFPLTAGMEADFTKNSPGPARLLDENSSSRLIQGGAVYTSPFAPSVQSVQISLKTDGRPMNVRVELLQGPNNNKQVMDIYSENGKDRPFFGIIETPGTGNVVRIVNTATVEFPLNASIEPYIIDEKAEFGSDGDGMLWR